MKIGIIGITPEQFSYLRKDFDIKFIDYKRSKLDLPTSIDHLIVIAKTIKHDHMDQINKNYSRKNYTIKRNGGISSYKELLNELIQKEN